MNQTHCIRVTKKVNNQANYFIVVTQNECCTFRNEHVNFGRFGFSSRIHSTQIPLCCFTGKLKSTVSPLCGAEPFLAVRHNIRYVLTVGTKSFACLAGRKIWIYSHGWPYSFRKYAASRNFSYLGTFQNKCMFMCLVMWSSENFIHHWRYPEGAEIQKEDGCQLLTFRNFISLFKTREWIQGQTLGAELNTSIQSAPFG